MDVKCERCNTEYEFDDALVSGRGTTVKCTNCGHKFKIRRGDGDFSEDFWNITTGDGRTLVFTSLRELQRAIQSYLVERNDKLSRGGLPPKAIGQIPELLPFFEQRESARRRDSGQTSKQVKTQDGIGPAPVPVPPPPASDKPRQATKPEFLQPPLETTPALPLASEVVVPPPPGAPTLIGTGPLSERNVFEQPTRVATVPPPTEREPEPEEATEEEISTFSVVDVPGRPAPRSATASTDASMGTEEEISTFSVVDVPPGRPAAKNTVPMMDAPAVPAGASRPPPVPGRGSGPPRASASMPAAAASRPPPVPSRAPAAPAPPPAVSAPPPRPPAVSAPPPRPQPISAPPAVSAPPGATAPAPVRATSSPPTRSLRRDMDDDRPSLLGPEIAPRRRGVAGFVVSAVVLGALLTLGGMWAQKNLVGKPAGPATAATTDPRVAAFLVTGEKALADGNVDLAKESFDKASALDEKDPRALLDLARLAALRADVPWLKKRLLPRESADEHRVVEDELANLAAGAKKSAADAAAVAEGDPGALRAKVDALRIAGDREGARALVGKLGPVGAQPETAYVLAALDLAENEPLWPTVIERLKTAASAETGPGRARAALVYALARSGDGAAARAEVERLAAMPKAHPLLPLLRAFAERAKAAPIADAGADAAVAAVAAGEKPHAGGGGGGGGGGMPSDGRELVSQGERARSKGDYARASALFNAAVDKNPNDSEALAGLAAVAYAQHDLVAARGAYKRVLAANPNYMPALIGLADVEYDSGDKGTAAKLYKDIADRYPEAAYPARVKQRSEAP